MKQLLMTLAMLIVTASSAKAEDTDSLYTPAMLSIGTMVPDIVIDSIHNISLSSLRGRYVVLHFWASWCPDCRKDVPAVKELYDKYGSKVEFIGVSFDVDHNRWTKYVVDNGMKWRQVSELKKMRDAEISKAYGVEWIPSMTLIGPDGKVVLSTVVLERMAKALADIAK